MTRIIFMGTPDLAVPILAALAEMYSIAAVYTRPDKPAGRGRAVAESPVKQFAVAHNLPVEQPRTLRKDEAVARLREYRPDLVVVAAYGLILPQAVLDVPYRGCINTHASLLPRHRGASPITAAILAGDAETGITLMKMDAGLDTGPMLAAARIPIAADDTTGTLSIKLSTLAADLLRETLPRWLAGEITPTPQPETGVTYAGLLKKEAGRIDWNRPAAEIERMVRAYLPWPGTYTYLGDKLLKIVRAHVAPEAPSGEPGLVAQAGRAIIVTTGAGALQLDEVQLEGKRVLRADEFARGYPQFVRSSLGAHQSSR